MEVRDAAIVRANEMADEEEEDSLGHGHELSRKTRRRSHPPWEDGRIVKS